MRTIVALIVIIITATWIRTSNAESPDARGVESLGDQLLNELAPTALEQPRTSASDRVDNMNGAPTDPASPATRFDDLGEDIGQPSGALSLARVRQGMQHAESLLGGAQPLSDAGGIERAGEAQQQVVAQLDKLIAELSKQCQGGQCQASDQPPKPSQRSQKKPGKPGSAAGRGQTAARDSTDRLDRANAQPVDKGDVKAMAKDLWGHLPERSREQMMQSFSEEFLPKYELEIEQYYRRLSEEKGASRPQ